MALLATAAGSALAVSSGALAQQSTETVTVSASRITTAGFNAPTPTTVIGNDFIEQQAKDNVFTVVTQLPSLMGSTGQQVFGGISGGTNGLSSFNAFGLGTVRTLTLLDGQRFVPANVTGVPDISEFPQMLIQRVDVVSGGASASWGSDAVGGVINFVTNKKFEGFKANVSTGLSTYGDNASATVQAAAGTAFAGGRGHFEIAGEFSHEDGVHGGDKQLACCGSTLTNSLSGGRTWFKNPTLLSYATPAATPAGQPQLFVSNYGQPNQTARYGMINSGPLQGVTFLGNGNTGFFNYGTGTAGVDPNTGQGGTQQGVPALNGSASSAGTVTNCIVASCIGGELDTISNNGSIMLVPLTRGDVYTRLGYDVTPNFELFLTANWSQVGTMAIQSAVEGSSSLPGIAGGTGQSNTSAAVLTSSVGSTGSGNPGQILQAPGIQCGNAAGGPNAFLPASINAACVANKITSFGFGSLFYGTGPEMLYTQRDNRRVAVGADGTVNLFDTDWTWNGYYEHGENGTNIHITNNFLKPYLYAAIDSIAVSAANQATYPGIPVGTIVCRSQVANAEGCIPINPFGPVAYSQAQLNWIYGGAKWGAGAQQLSHQKQDAADFAISGTPLSDWAGKISVAAGAAYRQEAYSVKGDGAGNGTIAGSNGAPGSPCVDPLLNCLQGTNWFAGSFHNGQGNYHVIEGFVEFNVPLIDTPAFGTANLDIAGRHARYSTAGDANTWKVGLTWDTPVNGLRLRALQSRDIRAPNLSELFAAPVTTTPAGGISDPWTGQSLPYINNTIGNTALKPEKSINTELGVVFQPGWLPGFQTSVDYYRFGIAGAIASLAAATSVNLCFQGYTQYCSAIIVAPGTTISQANPQWQQVNSQFYNVASTVTDGLNIESSYQFNLNDWDILPIPGNFVVRGLGTHVSKFATNPGTPGSIISETAGNNDGSIPHWKVLLSESYTADNWEFHLTQNWISQGRHNMSWVVCTPGSCPVSTVNNPTVNQNYVSPIWYLNLGASFSISASSKVYGQIDNLFNKTGPQQVNGSSDGVNAMLYDQVGRMFHLGVRINN